MGKLRLPVIWCFKQHGQAELAHGTRGLHWRSQWHTAASGTPSHWQQVGENRMLLGMRFCVYRKWATGAFRAWLLPSLLVATGSAAEKASISIEIVTEGGAGITASQDWYKVFTDLGVTRLRIRSAGGAETSAIERSGTEGSPHYSVIGVLNADNVLELPGGRFSLRDKQRLKRWLEEVADLGAEGVTTERKAFGLTPSQLSAIQDQFSRPLGFSTQGAPARKVVDHIARGLKQTVKFSPGTQTLLGEVTIREELRELSTGTALAYVLHQAGLVVTPQRPRGGQLHLVVNEPEARMPAWPIGWKSSKSPLATCGDLFEQINADVEDTPVAEVLEVVQERLKIPFLLDRAALRAKNIDISKINASLPGRRLSYARILQLVLGEAKLSYELRIDDAEQPFLWIFPSARR